MTIRVLLADDDEAIRSAYAIILGAQPDIEVVGGAADGVEALELARRLCPDVVLADIRMPRLDGLELTRQLGGEFRVVVVTTFDLDEYVHAALRAGATGFLLKRSGPALLAEAVRAAVAGDTLISPQITVRLLKQLSQPELLPAQRHRAVGAGVASTGGAEALTARESEIAVLVADGATNAEIGAALFITSGTVKNHLASIQRKIGARNRVGIAAWAWEHARTVGG
ncbi:response regulator transcription factor [Streptomyces sp. BE20]|uniref:response regulator transcription factor n=1 Tax=Streptomyces sp. BE20 TaxID=3002525 RepID=UPI002E782B1A|nr:response regulator transcription factor [Streptomyces sp. BE20]MEE1827598.1 response regulator transcription factor [Streptomyces sp. BE20]